MTNLGTFTPESQITTDARKNIQAGIDVQNQSAPMTAQEKSVLEYSPIDLNKARQYFKDKNIKNPYEGGGAFSQIEELQNSLTQAQSDLKSWMNPDGTLKKGADGSVRQAQSAIDEINLLKNIVFNDSKNGSSLSSYIGQNNTFETSGVKPDTSSTTGSSTSSTGVDNTITNTKTALTDYLKSQNLPSNFAKLKELATQYGIANYSSLPSENTQLLNALKTGAPKQQAPANGSLYSVKSGDTLSKIANQFGVSLDTLLSANPTITNPNLIYPNQKINVLMGGNVDATEIVNKTQEQLFADATKTDSTNNGIEKATLTEEAETSTSEPVFKMPSSTDIYNKFLNTEDIKNSKQALIDYDKELAKLDAQEQALEDDIRSQIEGEAPESVIRAMVAEKARRLYPLKASILAEKNALQAKLTNDLENAKNQWTMALQDQENGLKYLDTLIAGGTKLTAEQMKTADETLGFGTGFTKSYVSAKQKAASLDDLKTRDTILSLQSQLPSTQSFEWNGETYYGTKGSDNKTQFLTYGGNVWKVTVDDNGKIISETKMGSSEDDTIKPPSSYTEWELAGGLAGTGKTYAQWVSPSAGTPKQYQYTAANFATRLDSSGDIISTLEDQFTGAEGYVGKYLPNVLKSSERQQLEQAQKNFLNAVLRRESGAVISDSEFANGSAQYFPQPGDTTETLAQKRKNREMVTKNIINEAGIAIDEVNPALRGKYGLDSIGNVQTIKFTDINDFKLKASPQEKAEFNALRSVPELQDKTPEELFEFYTTQSFSDVGGDTNTAILSKVTSAPVDTKGGQCGRFVNKLTGLGVGDSFESKMVKMNPKITYPAPGMVFTMPVYKNGKSDGIGHTGFILSVKDGIATVKDSNWYTDSKPETITIHQIPVSKMTGFANV